MQIPGPNLNLAMQMEISFGMMVIPLVCRHLFLFLSSLIIMCSYRLTIVDSIETKTYNYFEFNLTSAVS
jgi:hypothetical protein